MKKLNKFLASLKKREFISAGIVSVIMAIFTAIGFLIVFNKNVYSEPEFNYVKQFTWSEFWLFWMRLLISFVVYYVLIMALQFAAYCYQKKHKKKNEPTMSLKKTYFIVFGIFILAWLPYFLTHFPGGVFFDTYIGFYEAENMGQYGVYALENHYPIFYTLLLGLIMWIANTFMPGLSNLVPTDYYDPEVLSPNIVGGIVLTYFLQFILFAAVLAYVVCWLKKRGLSKTLYRTTVAFFALFPLFPLYMISIWKDTPFSLALIMLVLALADLVLTDFKLLASKKFILKFAILCLLVCFLRNNGKYIIFVVLLAIAIYKRKMIYKYAMFCVTACLIVIGVSVIQGPVYDHFHFNDMYHTGETLGVPLQQIAYLLYYDYDLSEDDLAYAEAIFPKEYVKISYAPFIFDTIKFDYDSPAEDFHPEVIEANRLKFFVFYAKMLVTHPIAMIKGYMLNTAGFWAPNIYNYFGYAQDYMFVHFSLENYNLMEEWFGFSVKPFEMSLPALPASLLVFAMLITIAILIGRRAYKWLFVMLPGFLTWATVLVAAPVAISLRYVYVLLLMIPIEIFMIMTVKAENKKFAAKADGKKKVVAKKTTTKKLKAKN